MLAEIPQKGLWGIASGHQSLEETNRWLEKVGKLAALSYRLPKCSDAVAVASIRAMRSQTDWLAIHARFDWAFLIGANAVVRGWRSLPNEEIPEHIKLPEIHSTHSLDEVEEAQKNGAAAVLFGPVWDTPSKRGLVETQGISQLKLACKLGIPVIALGGISTREQVKQCRDVGAHGCAILGAAPIASTLSVEF